MPELPAYLKLRANGNCELCGATNTLEKPIELIAYQIPESPKNVKEKSLALCPICLEQLQETDKLNADHWRFLNDTIWSQIPEVQVVSYRMLDKLKQYGWPLELMDMMYMDDEVREWANASILAEPALIHRDAHGAVLSQGDSVVLIKDLDVKGANFTAKRGTAVRNINLVHDNDQHIEGKISAQHIVILTQYVKKTS